LDDEKSTSSFCGRCSSLISQVYDLYNNKSEIDLELTGIRYKLLDNLVNDEGIQSNEDLNELKQLHLERFTLFHKVRTALNLDPREPQLSPHDKIEKYHGMHSLKTFYEMSIKIIHLILVDFVAEDE
jgi:hypothetical protein